MRPHLPVLASSAGWVVVAKPPGLLVHRNALTPTGDAALQRVRNQMKQRVFPVHRLDRAASGCLLFALDREWAATLQAAITSPHARKQYLAFVRGEFRHDGAVFVDNPMLDDNGILKDARSIVRCIGRSAEPRCSLLLVTPETGRYHQVRRHVRDLTHPIVGDTKHGDSRVNRWWRETYGMHRLALHCVSLELPLPDGSLLTATCPLFDDMARVFARMPWWEKASTTFPLLEATPLPGGPDPASTAC